MSTNRRWILARLPQGVLTVDDFELRPVDVDLDGDVPPDHVACRVLWLSIDAAGRAWMQGATYREAVEADDLMAGYGIAEVVHSNVPLFAPGQLVAGRSAGRTTPWCPPAPCSSSSAAPIWPAT